MCWGRLFARFNKEREKSEKISKPDRQIDKQITFYQFRLRSKSKCQHLPINFSWRLRVISFECKFQSTFFHFLTTMQINTWKNFWWKRKKLFPLAHFYVYILALLRRKSKAQLMINAMGLEVSQGVKWIILMTNCYEKVSGARDYSDKDFHPPEVCLDYSSCSLETITHPYQLCSCSRLRDDDRSWARLKKCKRIYLRLF